MNTKSMQGVSTTEEPMENIKLRGVLYVTHVCGWIYQLDDGVYFLKYRYLLTIVLIDSSILPTNRIVSAMVV